MAAAAPSPPARKSRRELVSKTAQIVVCVLIALPLGYVVDGALAKLVGKELPRFVDFLRWPRRTLSQATESPGVYRGLLYSGQPRTTPSGETAALYFARVTRTEQSGRSTVERTVCEWNQVDGLELVEKPSGASAVVELAKDASDWHLARGKIEGIAFSRVVLATGRERQSRQIPSAMRRHCGMLLGSKLSYHELHIASGAAVTVYGCWRDGALRRCTAGGIAGGLTTEPRALMAEAYAAHLLSTPRMIALVAALLLGYLASTLLELPPPPYARPSKRPEAESSDESEPEGSGKKGQRGA